MGMNYYAKISKKQKDIINNNTEISDLAKICVDRYELHIGKSSMGWKFMFQVQEVYSKGQEIILDTFEKWKAFILQDIIEVYNEDNELVDKDWLLKFIKEKQKEKHPDRDEDFDCFRSPHDFESEDGYRMCDVDFS